MPAVKDRAERVLESDVQEALHKYAGRWVVVTRDQIVSAGDTPQEAWAEAVERGVTEAALYRVPEKDTVFIL